jgi:K+-transporting ATPase ATPase B chain
MIAMVEGAQRRKTPNEIALTILLIALTWCSCWPPPPSGRSPPGAARGQRHGAGGAAGVPDPDHHRRPAVGHRRRRDEPYARRQRDRHQRRAVEAAGDVDVLLLDKTGTITLGNRQASISCLRAGVEENLADAAQLSSLADETPEGRSIVVLANSALTCASAICSRCTPPLCPLPPRPG